MLFVIQCNIHDVMSVSEVTPISLARSLANRDVLAYIVWSLWSGVGSLFTKQLVEKNYEKRIFSEQIRKDAKSKFETFSQHRIGIITKKLPDYCIIDHKFYVKLSELKCEVKQNDKVKFIAYGGDTNRELQVKNVTAIETDQDIKNESLIIKENATICKNVVGTVTQRIGRNLTIEPPGVVCSLDKVKADFPLTVGDHVLMTVIVEQMENDEESVIDVKKITCLRWKQFDGRITHLEDDDEDCIRGIINHETYFTNNVCDPNYTPAVNDEVIVKAIESDQGSLSWRAICVIPAAQDVDIASIIIEDETLFDDKNGLIVTVRCSKKVLRIGECGTNEIVIENNGDKEHFLKNVRLFSFQESDILKVNMDSTKPILIPAGGQIIVNIEVKPNSSGYFTESAILTFEGDFHIGGMIDFYVKSEQTTPRTEQSNNTRVKNIEKRNAAVKKLTTPTKQEFIVPGVRPIKPPPFIPNRLDLFPIPKHLANILIGDVDTFRKFSEIEESVIKLYPSMIEELNEKNYLLKFHNLLHIEDQELSIAIKKYDRDHVSFGRRGEYLSLEMPNLSESRLSLVIGDKVLASDPAIFGNNHIQYEGFIHKVCANAIYLKFNEAFHSSYNGKEYSVTFIPSRIGIRRCHQAINLVHAHLGREWLFPDTLNNLKRSQVIISKEQPPIINKQTEKAHVCKEDDTEQSSIAYDPREFVRKEGVLIWINKKLNHYQKDAVRNILKGEARPFPYVILGPPGTGKTVTVIETILQIKLHIPYSRILVATPSNSSTDLICDRLLSWNLLSPGDLVRIVGFNYINDDRVPARVKPYCTVVDMKNGNMGDGTYEENGIKYSNKQAIGRHTITVGTCVSIGILYTMGFPRGHFTHIIIDEAGQATEPEISIPLAFLSNENQAILAGDPRQLGPVIISRIAEKLGLGESLLNRLLMRFPYYYDPESYPDTNGYDPRLVTWLLYNYRSLPQILHLYSDLFYDAKLQPMVCDKCSPEIAILNTLAREIPQVKNGPIIFHGVRGVNTQEEDSPSWFNDYEIVKVLDYLHAFYRCGLKSTDVGIITPYQKQVLKIRNMVRRCDLDVPKIGSVEEFQGQERKVIILSTVKSDEGLLDKNNIHALGFVASKQRLNVAISRARCVLVIIGNPHLLVKDISWRSLLKTCIENKWYVGCDLPFRHRTARHTVHMMRDVSRTARLL